MKFFYKIFILSVLLLFSANNSNCAVYEKEHDKKQNLPEKKYSEKIVKIVNRFEFKKNGDKRNLILTLAIISVLCFPFALHNWYLKNYKKALFQSLLIFPGIFLIFPFVVSWIWQLSELIFMISNYKVGLPPKDEKVE